MNLWLIIKFMEPSRWKAIGDVVILLQWNRFEIPLFWKIFIGVVALLHSIIYSLFAFKIHGADPNIISSFRKGKNRIWFFHQWWINYLGAITGWFTLWLLIPAIRQSIFYHSIDYPSLQHLIMFFISILGISGYIPYTLIGIGKN